MSNAEPSPTSNQGANSPWAPFRHASFAVVWIATVISNIGGWMYSAASGWLMTDLNPDPFIVSMVQVATTLPIFLFALPAGAVADIVNRRKFLILAEVLYTIVAAIFAAIVWSGAVTPGSLLLFTFLMGVGGALTAPVWQSIVPQLVPRQVLTPAVAANSVGVNVSRAVGPALGGVLAARMGIAAPFWFNAVSNLAVIGALLWWHPPEKAARLPVERFGRAVLTGFRHARNNAHLRATLIRSAAFFLFASAYWALLPLVARNQIAGGPDLYGYMLGAIGAAAVAMALGLPWLKARLGPDRLVAAGTVGTALAMVIFAFARDPATALTGSVAAGASWIAVLASLNVSAQVALPDWVRGRGLAIFTTGFFGCLSLGSAIWGQMAGTVGLPATQLIAAIGAVLAIPATWRWKLLTGAEVDLAPSMHWPAPVLARDIESDGGPVLVTIEYQVTLEDRAKFLEAIAKLANERRRDGAFEWGVFEDLAHEGHFVETFMLNSWIEHLRQHERVTNADREVQELVNRFQTDGTPKVTHLIAADLDKPVRSISASS